MFFPKSSSKDTTSPEFNNSPVDTYLCVKSPIVNRDITAYASSKYFQLLTATIKNISQPIFLTKPEAIKAQRQGGIEYVIAKLQVPASWLFINKFQAHNQIDIFHIQEINIHDDLIESGSVVNNDFNLASINQNKNDKQDKDIYQKLLESQQIENNDDNNNPNDPPKKGCLII